MSHCSNIVDYRQKLFKSFEGAQQRFLERKKERRVQNQLSNLCPLETEEDFLTVNPKNPSLALKKRKVIKESRGALKRVIERYFVIDNVLITFFEKESDTDFKKNSSLDGAFVFVESIEETDDRWHDRKCRHRVQIILPQRQAKPIFFYSNDLNEAKILAARIYMSSDKRKRE